MTAPAAEVLDLLTRLVDKSMVVVQGGAKWRRAVSIARDVTPIRPGTTRRVR